MDKQQHNDIRLFKKAKRRVALVLILIYIVISIWPGAIYFLLGQPIFQRPPQFTLYYLLAMIIEMVVWMLIFFALSSGKPATRYLLIVGILAQFGFVAYLIYSVFLLPQYVLVFGLWAALEMVRNALLIWLNKWLRHSWYAKIFFDKTITVSKHDRRSQKWGKQSYTPNPNEYGNPYDDRYDQRYFEHDPYQNQYENPYSNGYDEQYTNSYGDGYAPNGDPYSNHYNEYYDDSYATRYTPAYDPSNTASPNIHPIYDDYYDDYDEYNDGYEDDYSATYSNSGHWQNSYRPSDPSSFDRYYPPEYSQPDQFDANGYEDYANPYPGYDGQDYYNQVDIQSTPVQQNDLYEDAVRIQPQAPLDIEGNSLESAQTRRQQEMENRRLISSRYPRMAIKIAICVFGELILFPALVHIFKNSFVSIDNTHVFATNLMFTLSILTAAIWTPAIFFLYLKQPGVKKAVYLSTVVQLIALCFGGWMLWQFHQGETITYSNKVFLYFILLELVRYGILFFVIKPVFELDEIYKTNDDPYDELDDQGNPYQNYSFEITEEDPLEEVDEDEKPFSERFKEGSVLIAKSAKKGMKQLINSSKKK